MKNQGLRLGALRAALAAASALAMPAQAQDTDPVAGCAYQPGIGDLVGVYNATVGPGALTSDGATIPMTTIQTYGPVTYLCRSQCSFRPLGVRRPRGFCLPMLSADGAGYRSR